MGLSIRRAWRVSKPQGYTIAAILISLGGFLNGFDTGAIGAITTMPYFEKTFGPISPSLQGFTVSLIMLTGALPAFFAGQLAHRFGHLSVIMGGALISVVGCVMEAAASQLPVLLVGRAFAGIGEGALLCNVFVYITEIAPSAKRGNLVSMPQLFVVSGICAGYFTCYGSIKIDSQLSWRLPFIFQTLVSIALAVSCYVVPDSPRWLLLHNRREKALRALERLGVSRVEVEKDLARSLTQIPPQKVSTWRSVTSIFSSKYRSRTGLGLFVLGMVQLCGIDGVIYYAPILFAQAGLPAGTASFLASGVSAILLLAISIPAYIYADRWGRRTSIITGGIGLTFCMYLIGTMYATDSVHSNQGAGRWVVIVAIFCFALTYSATWAMVGKIYASEVQPVETRAAANSVAQGLGFFTNWLVAITTPIFLSKSSYGAYFLFGSLSLFTLVVLVLFMPETRGHSLESIQETFQLHQTGRKLQKVLSGLRFRGGRKSTPAITKHGSSTGTAAGDDTSTTGMELQDLGGLAGPLASESRISGAEKSSLDISFIPARVEVLCAV
ncbi:hypothetical protein MMC25_005417 [Agyrium rufum]|nr:hypothetical protein [Agyrium rufum]